MSLAHPIRNVNNRLDLLRWGRRCPCIPPPGDGELLWSVVEGHAIVGKVEAKSICCQFPDALFI